VPAPEQSGGDRGARPPSPTWRQQLRCSRSSAQLEPVVAAAGHDPGSAALRSGLVARQILGLALCHDILRLPPVVALEPEAVVRWLGPVIQTYLADPPPLS